MTELTRYHQHALYVLRSRERNGRAVGEQLVSEIEQFLWMVAWMRDHYGYEF